jgi:hypothetical protein
MSTRLVSTVSKPPTPPIEFAMTWLGLGKVRAQMLSRKLRPGRTSARRAKRPVLGMARDLPKIVRANFRVAKSAGNRQKEW